MSSSKASELQAVADAIRSGDRTQVVDDPLGVLLPHVQLVEVAAQEVRADQASALVHLRPLEGRRLQLQLLEGNVLVHLVEDVVEVGAGLEQLGREPVGLRCRVGVPEAAGVGDERDVERLGDLGRQADLQLCEQITDDLARRGCVRDDQVDPREARVVVVVVDVQRQRHAGDQLRVEPGAAGVRAVEREEDPLRGVLRKRAPQRGPRASPFASAPSRAR